ncbi:putative glycine dehydrogenase (decarboxylating) subunit 2 [Candidatus Zixiibacteriota bacterium]|nr:putative glycine dehydrogenase (decarboxylating) subunit 2 [candidate division Zixibacteria bacterium]
MNDKILIYEKSVPGRIGASLPETGADENEILGLIPEKHRRSEDALLPESTEGEVMRHFVALSVKNHHIDKGFYPLGSCTMKYNPKLNDVAASMPGFINQHPLAPCRTAAGSLQIMSEMEDYLKEISGFAAISLQPVAGAHGEFAGLLIIRAYHKDKGKIRKKVLIPDSAHGTNPASVTMVGYEAVQIKSNEKGMITPEAVAAAIDDETAALMITNPNTLGLFESEIVKVAEVVHRAGALLYMDGANLNAQLGVVKPGQIGFDVLHFNLHKTFSTPHGGGGPGAGAVAVVEKLAPFLPVPVISRKTDENNRLFLDYDRPKSIGRMHSFYGNFANIIRAYAYIRSLGAVGLRRVSENAVLNANYLRVLLHDEFEVPYDRTCMHEFVLSCDRQKKFGVKGLDIAKRLLDYGYHAPTVYFPLIVHEAFMIEPTETESRETLESFAATLIAISKEAEKDPEMIRHAPYSTPVRRLDEVKAARELDVCYRN